jgi:hypothetical protein
MAVVFKCGGMVEKIGVTLNYSSVKETGSVIVGGLAGA